MGCASSTTGVQTSSKPAEEDGNALKETNKTQPEQDNKHIEEQKTNGRLYHDSF